MKLPLLYTLVISTFSATVAHAIILPSLEDKGWSSFYAGFQGSGIEMGVDTKGQLDFYFTPKKNDRLNGSWPIETEIHIERRKKGETKWSQRTTATEGFTPKGDVEFGQKDVEFVATVTGDVKFKAMITFDKNGAEIQAEMASKPDDLDEYDYRLVLESGLPTLMKTSSDYDEKELKSKTRGDEVRLEFKDEKDESIKIYEASDAEKLTSMLPTSITVKAEKIGRKKFTFSKLDPKSKGAMELDFKSTSKRFLDGFNIRLILIDEKGERLNKGLRLEYK